MTALLLVDGILFVTTMLVAVRNRGTILAQSSRFFDSCEHSLQAVFHSNVLKVEIKDSP